MNGESMKIRNLDEALMFIKDLDMVLKKLRVG